MAVGRALLVVIASVAGVDCFCAARFAGFIANHPRRVRYPNGAVRARDRDFEVQNSKVDYAGFGVNSPIEPQGVEPVGEEVWDGNTYIPFPFPNHLPRLGVATWPQMGVFDVLDHFGTFQFHFEGRQQVGLGCSERLHSLSCHFQ